MRFPAFPARQENTGSDANVYYIRGVNVEHGTDFAIFLDGMPINMPTHAHAQGFANLNFMIPELIEVVDYRKGSYYADLGDFSTLGAARISLFPAAARIDRSAQRRPVRLGARTDREHRAAMGRRSALRGRPVVFRRWL